MPASDEFTCIKLMRGTGNTVVNWIPEVGEPLLETVSGTLSYGDGTTMGGLVINSMTSRKLEPPVDLNTQLTWGRFFVDGRSENLPNNLMEAKYFLTVQTSEFRSPEIRQEIEIINDSLKSEKYHRITLDKGKTWSKWYDSASFQSTNTGTFDNDPDLNHYTSYCQAYVSNFINGPLDSNGGSAFVFVYRPDSVSPYIFQRIIITNPDKYSGRIFFRFSVDGNLTWNSPGYTWREMLGAAPVDTRNPDLTFYY